jgi:lactoylglutathione lyase
VKGMRTLHVGLRVTDRERSLAFYVAVGYEVVGEVAETSIGHLTMLKLPADDFVTLELVHDPAAAVELGTGLSHLVIRVEAMDAALTSLAARGIIAETPSSPNDSEDFLTSWITDPDGRRIELVQWPPGHAEGMTTADFPERND